MWCGYWSNPSIVIVVREKWDFRMQPEKRVWGVGYTIQVQVQAIQRFKVGKAPCVCTCTWTCTSTTQYVRIRTHNTNSSRLSWGGRLDACLCKVQNPSIKNYSYPWWQKRFSRVSVALKRNAFPVPSKAHFTPSYHIELADRTTSWDEPAPFFHGP